MQARAVDFAWHAHIVPLAATAAARGGPNADQVLAEVCALCVSAVRNAKGSI